MQSIPNSMQIIFFNFRSEIVSRAAASMRSDYCSRVDGVDVIARRELPRKLCEIQNSCRKRPLSAIVD